MIVLTIRTDKPEAEIGLYADEQQLTYVEWQAHRQLAETLLGKIRDIVEDQKMELKQLQGIVCYKGPGSFTGLRIGLTVANTLSNALEIPIVSETSDQWQVQGIRRLRGGENESIALPEYGADVHITLQKK